MRYPFHVGENVMVVDQENPTAGSIVTIVQPLRDRSFTLPNGELALMRAYVVQYQNGEVAVASPCSLGKWFEVGSWDAMRSVWRPKRERRT